MTLGLTLIIVLLFCGNLYSQQKKCFDCTLAPAGTIFCDDFEDTVGIQSKYFGYSDDDGEFIPMNKTGRDGSRGMRVKWQTGEVEAGGLQVLFGRSAHAGERNVLFPGKDFNEIYWRIDVKTQPGWKGGGGDKLSRATVLAGPGWNQGMIAHLWSGSPPGNEYLVMDPASGISKDGILKSTRYNDFENLRWLGNKRSKLPLFSEANSGIWFCITAHAKLNTPGKSDGVFEVWINDTLQSATYNLNWHGTWNRDPKNYQINAVFFENYWNSGALKDQERYFDNIIISTTPIKCSCGSPE